MRTSLSCVALLGLALCSSACSSSDDSGGGGVGGASGGCPQTGDGPAALECQVLDLVNQTRAAGTTCSGVAMPPVPALTMNAILRQVARAHAEDMATNGYFAHENLAGQSPADRVTAAGYDWSAVGENIAAGKTTAEATMQQWLTSTEGHCENVMSEKFTEIGVGYAYSETHQYEHLWVQNFGRPMN